MKAHIRLCKLRRILGGIVFLPYFIAAQTISRDTLSEQQLVPSLTTQRFIHKIGLEGRPEYIFPTNEFLKGENEKWEPIRWGNSIHLKYAFQFAPHTYTSQIYGKAYQGIGIAHYSLDNKKELGTPTAFYLFQGAQIAQLTPRASFNYEWQFGLSTGWKPYDWYENQYNHIIGSKANAYINLGFQLNWMINSQIDINSGFTLTHFSNGNTEFPNYGLNTIGWKIGIVYNFNRKKELFTMPLLHPSPILKFPKHVSYDLTLFGSWRRKGVITENEQIPSPDSYTVLGFNFAPMYNFGYKFRAGASIDGVYDNSANVYTENYVNFLKPASSNQLALGLSARGEYVMPYFTIGLGLGSNILYKGNDFKGLYQILTLKIELTRSSFFHIGYNLKDFHDPNYLMLGIGFRFNNKYPTLHR